MVNHLRCLLLGRPGSETPAPLGFAEEYVPADFVPPEYSRKILLVRRILFGQTPDRAFLNYRLAELVPLCHTPRLTPYALAFDQRITYDSGPRTDVFNRLATPWVVTTTVGSDSLTVLGTPRESGGKLYLRWHVRVIDADTLGVTPHDQDESEVSYTTSGGTGTALLPGQSGVRLLFVPVTDNAWDLEGAARPLVRLPAVLDRLDGAPIQDLLDSQDDLEPYTSFRNLWSRHDRPQDQLAAVALALAWQTEALRST